MSDNGIDKTESDGLKNFFMELHKKNHDAHKA